MTQNWYKWKKQAQTRNKQGIILVFGTWDEQGKIKWASWEDLKEEKTCDWFSYRWTCDNLSVI